MSIILSWCTCICARAPSLSSGMVLLVYVLYNVVTRLISHIYKCWQWRCTKFLQPWWYFETWWGPHDRPMCLCLAIVVIPAWNKLFGSLKKYCWNFDCYTWNDINWYGSALIWHLYEYLFELFSAYGFKNIFMIWCTRLCHTRWLSSILIKNHQNFSDHHDLQMLIISKYSAYAVIILVFYAFGFSNFHRCFWYFPHRYDSFWLCQEKTITFSADNVDKVIWTHGFKKT